jgi:3-phenylpropionate/cinnamic acid dioxygenase small subunit
VLEGFQEFDDGVTLQILSVFPGFVLQQIQNCLAVRQVLPKGQAKSELNWTYIGYTDDTPEQRTVRLKQLNLVGPAGFISMEDGAVGGFVQRGIAGARDQEAIIEMGGDDDRLQRRPRHRDLGARLLESLPPAHGSLSMTDLRSLCAFNAAYANAIDSDALEQWPAFFAEKCMYRITNVENEREGLPAGIVYADSRAMLEDRIAALREANIYERQRYRHLLGVPLVESTDADGAVARTPFLVARIMATGETGAVRHRRIPRPLHRAGRQAAAGRARRGVRQHRDRHAAGLPL